MKSVFFSNLLILGSSLSLEWVAVSPAGQGPGPRYRSTLGVSADGSDHYNSFVFGGLDGGNTFNDLWVFSSRSQSWGRRCADSTVAPLGRYDGLGGLVSVGGSEYFVVGSGEGRQPVTQFFADVWACDLAGGQWRRLDAEDALRPEPRYGASGGLQGGTFVMSHGFSAVRYSNTFTLDVEAALSRQSGIAAWVEAVEGTNPFNPFEPHARCLVGTTVFENSLYMAGGCAHQGETGGPCPARDTWKMDLGSNEWSRLPDSPTAVEFGDVAFMKDGKRMVQYGGIVLEENTVITAKPERRATDVHVLDTDADEWTSYTAKVPSSWNAAVPVHRVRLAEVPRSTNPVSSGGQSLQLFLFGGGASLDGVLYALIETDDGANTTREGWYFFSMIYLHGIFMFVGWGVFLQFGAFAFRYFKHHESKWAWMAHRGAQSFGLLCAIVGFILSFYTGGNFKFSHARIGIAVMVMGVLNPLTALFRCHPGQSKNLLGCGFNKRWIFNLVHHLLGRAALVLALINIALGISISQAPIGWWIAFMVWIGVIVLAYAVCELLRAVGKLPRISRTKEEQYLCGLGDAKLKKNDDLTSVEVDTTAAIA